MLIKPLIIMYAKMSRAISARHHVRERGLRSVQKACDTRYTERATLWNIGIFKVHLVRVYTYTRVYPKGNANRQKKDSIKNNVRDVNVDARANLFMILHKTLIIHSLRPCSKETAIVQGVKRI